MDLRIVQVRDRMTGKWAYEKTCDPTEARRRVKLLKAQGYSARSIPKPASDYAASADDHLK